MTQNHSFVIIEIDGNRYEVFPDEAICRDWNPIENGIFHVRRDDQDYEIRVLHMDMISGQCTISIDGQIKQLKWIREIDVMIEKMGLNASHAKKESTLYAPMPGLVAGIKVSQGQHVDKGTPLMILEAMKMENVIAAPYDTVVKHIGVTVGQAVERGFPLIEFSTE